MIARREPALDAGVSSERARLLALARVLVHDAAEADDVVHEALVAALDRDEPLREPGPWLRHVLRNEVRGRARRRARREAHLVKLVEPLATATHEEAVARREVVEAVWDTLTELEEPYRETLRLRFLDEQSPSEIADASGDPPSTVRWRIHEGIRRLRRRLDERFGGRAHWCGGFAVAVGLPASTPVKGLVGSISTLFKIALVIAAVALATVAAASNMWSEPDVDDEASNPATADQALASSAHVVHRSAPTSVRDASEPRSPAPGADAIEKDGPEQSFRRAVRDCIMGAPAGSLDGIERLELDFVTFGADEGTVWHEVRVTTGREIPDDNVGCSDEPVPVDGKNVIHHEEIRSCLLASVDPSWVPVPPPFPGEYSGIMGYIVPLDGTGGIKPHPPRAPLPLPDVTREPAVDPQQAVEAFGLRQLGASEAQLEIIVCGSYDCPFSRKSEETLDQARELYPDLATAWLNFPLSPLAVMAAKAALAADRQGRFWAMHAGLFELFETREAVEQDDLVTLAESVGLDVERFVTDLDDAELGRTIARHRQTCKTAGAWATPTFFVNGDMLRGELGIERLADFIEEVLALESSTHRMDLDAVPG